MGRYSGRIITKNPVAPSGPAPTSTAPGMWTLPEVTYWKAQGRWPDASADPYWSYVSYLLSTTATNAQQNNTFLDSSTNNFTITRFGNTTQGSATPYGTLWSNYFDGAGDYLTAPSNAAFNILSGGDFTVEAWVNFTSLSDNGGAGAAIMGRTGTLGAGIGWVFRCTPTAIQFVYPGLSANSQSFTFSTNTWYHLVAQRSGTTLYYYVNGTRYTPSYSDRTTDASTDTMAIGRSGNDSSGSFAYLNGYISNVRIVKGTAVYSGAAITPPTAPLTAITNTSLLTCQSNRFKDNSTNNFAITKNGDTKVTAFSPFILAPPGYTTTANGGSGYFDGTGDGLTAPNNAAFNLSNGDFTLECWVYNSEVANSIGYAGVWGTSYILYRIGTSYRFYYYGPSGSPLTSSIAAVANTWTHLAVVRNGSTLSFYVDGVLGASTNVSTTAFSSIGSQPFGIGANFETGSVGFPFTGYMAGLRLVTGTAVYTSAFTPPTTPVTAVSGTSLLCNFTNAGIYDAAMNNDMETVGNAQVSSAQVKYGTTSAYFDGTGDVLTMPTSPAFSFGTGDFTVECWLYFTSYGSGNQNVIDFRGSAGSGNNIALYLENVGGTGTKQLRAYNGTADAAATSNNFPLNTWTHVAITRASNNFRFFVGGSQVGSTTTVSTNYVNTAGLYVGAYAGNVANFYGYIDDLRITKGVARYTASFTPPTAALPVY